MIINRAFVKEVLQNCRTVTAILASILLITRLVAFLKNTVNGDIPINSVLLLLILKITTYLDTLIPLVLYISVFLVVNRWVRDNEFTVISTCGIGIHQFLKPAMILFSLFAPIVAICSLYLSPLAEKNALFIQQEYIQNNDIFGINVGKFSKINKGQGIYFLEKYDKEQGIFQDIFFYNKDEKKSTILIAESAYKKLDTETNNNFLILTNGAQYQCSHGMTEYSKTEFEIYAVRLQEQSNNYSVVIPLKARSTAELLSNKNQKTAIGEFNWRISKIAMLPTLIIYALSFFSISYQKHPLIGSFSALLIYFSYSSVLGLFITLIEHHAVNSHHTLWIVHCCFLGIAIYIFYNRCVNKPLFSKFVLK